MKKSILAIFLAVIAMAQVHAQDSDLRSAPDLPTFKVTLNYSSANTDQGTITSTVATGSKVAYNSKPVFTITAKPGYVLSDITMNTATIGTLPSGTFQNDNTTTYSYTSTALTGSTEIKAVFKAKEQVTVTISPEYATLDEIRAKVNLPKVTFDPVITGYKVQYREDGSAALMDELPEKAGLYYVVVTKSETDTQAAINKEILFKVQPPHTLSYSFEEAQGSVTASMDGSIIASGDEIVYNKPAVLKIASKPGYVLSRLTVDNNEVTLPKGTFNSSTNETSYADYTTSALTASTVIDVRFAAKKTVSVTANPLSATKDEVLAGKNLPVITFSPNTIAGQKVQYKNASGALSDKLPAADGVYTVVATSPETAEYAALKDENMKFTVSKANVLNYNVETAGQGTVTAKMGSTDMASGSEIINGQPAVFTIIANPGFLLNKIVVNGTAVSALPKGALNKDNTISYTYTTASLTASTTLSVGFAAKKTISVSVTGSSATKDEIVAGKNLPVIKFTPEIAGQAVRYRAADGSETSTLPQIVGAYKIVLFSPETMEYAALEDSSKTFTIRNANTLAYAVDGGQGTVTAKMNNKDIMSGGEIAYGKPVIFSIVSNANYRLGAIKQASSDVDISKIKGTYANGNTSYTYTTPNLMSGDSYTFAFVSKDTVRFVANNLVQTVGSIKPVTVTSAVGDIKIEYQLSGTAWVTTLPSTLAVGSYKARLSRAEDLTYRSLSDTVTLVVESKKEVESLVLPTPGRIEEGQALSACTLIDGTSSGSFIWKTPNEIASPDKKKYDLIFEPNDPVHYAAKDTFITLNVIPVYSMNVTAGNFGTVILEGRTANDKYARGSVLKATAVADKNYRFAGWSDGNTSATRELQANANLDIVARFDPVLYGVTFTDPMNGSLKVFANGVEVKNGAEFLQGTLLTITATPDAGYMVQSVKVNGALVNNGSYTLTQAADISADFLQKEPDKHLVKVGELKNGSVNVSSADRKKPEITVTLAADATYTPNFVDKPKITANPSDLEFVYNGSVRLVELKDILSGSYPTDVNIKYSNTDGSVATPLNAGTYLVTVTRTGDENWRSFEATKKLVIKKAKVVKVVAPTASTITEGQSLSESLLSGGVAKGADGTTISGKFEWADASAILKPGNSQKKEVIFTSYDPNYEDATTEAEVTVKSSDALVVTFAQPENGSLKVYMLKGEGEKTEITSGTAVAKATKLTIEAEANPDYELTVIQIGEEKYMTSPVEIEVDKSLAIMAEFKPVSTPPGTDVAVTGVSLNITSKALAVGESFALQAKVTPNNATMKTVSWSSSDETVATVDADGVVTALKIGTCKITVATDDGNKTASCVVTVSGTVGIEQIINDHQIYCERGAITIHPARPISIRIIAVTGVSLYGDSIIGTTRIPVSTGIYLIEINENGKRITVKVNVR